MKPVAVTEKTPEPRTSVARLFCVALRLGLTSFGGPAAHIGYFRREYDERRGWLDERGFADLLALCQFLPGPASSQFGFAVGLQRRGLLGGVVAWLGFTLPSAVLMLLFAAGVTVLPDLAAAGWLRGLKVAAVAVVAQAVWQMGRSLCPDLPRFGLAVAALLALALWPAAWVQMATIGGGALLGWLLLRGRVGAPVPAPENGPVARRRAGVAWLAVFVALLVVLPLLGGDVCALSSRFYRVGALVFGGGHVVLPLLEAEVVGPGWLSHDQFLAGYGAAQALPGPLFAFSAYWGAISATGPGGVAGGLIALVSVFLPGLLLVVGVWPFWQRLRAIRGAQAALAGANAAVVGVLAAAFWRPVLPAGVTDARSLWLAVALFAGLQWAKLPAWAMVLAAVAGGSLWL